MEGKGEVLTEGGLFQEMNESGVDEAGIGKSRTGKTLMLGALFLARDFTTSGIGIRTVAC
jgi:hypothetical protein